jgi:hypothetical protein
VSLLIFINKVLLEYKYYILILIFVFIETRSHYVAQVGLELAVLFVFNFFPLKKSPNVFVSDCFLSQVVTNTELTSWNRNCMTTNPDVFTI